MQSLKEEIRQNQEFESVQQEAIISLLLTTDRLKRRLSDLTGQYDITPQQYNVLRILYGAGSRGLPTLEIMNRMIERSPGITRLLDRIDRKGLMTKQRSTSDRRTQICTITPEGIRLIDEMSGPMKELTRDVMSHLDDKKLRDLLELLFLVRKGM
ncbi:MarR family winged helix-turn-helix transcriptional regulator [Natronogracilivirga saccharolytica]|uniref:MarR family transcriptional regulator n=1 Tax=Natronogracilivirga saccharolytica TaxID=2812953 RepID=A0A8J7RJU5_9BACT|nr:MarR family transcriptional regulator [Natronogracilivirga saccharolytica]MBP3192120.1 MarR family transcriptional regulator [Natronogracilivirga saccharolytica]